MRCFGRKDKMKGYQKYNYYELIYMVGENNEDAFSVLYDKYQPLLKKYAGQYYQYYKNYGIEYDDLCQEAYLAFDRAIRYYREDGETLFYTFLCITVRSKILNYIKGYQAKKNSLYLESFSLDQVCHGSDQCLGDYLEDPSALDPEREYSRGMVSMQVHHFCLDLDMETGQMFELYWNGFSNLEISQLLDIDLAKVLLSLRKARRLLRDYLGN